MTRREQLAQEWAWDTEEELDLLVWLDEHGILDDCLRSMPTISVQELIDILEKAQ